MSNRNLSSNHQRFEEIDILRGVALILMLIYHFLFDLTYLELVNISLDTTFWKLIARSSLIIFLLLVGIGISLKAQKETLYRKNKVNLFKTFFSKGIIIFALALLISITTKLITGDLYVRFGVLHLIAVSLIIFFPLRHFKKINLLISSIIIILSLLSSSITVQTSFFLSLGLTPVNFVSVDYVPFFPWSAVILIGIFLGNILYKNHSRQFSLFKICSHSLVKKLSCNGRQSLVIYLVHQPIIIVVLMIFKLLFIKEI